MFEPGIMPELRGISDAATIRATGLAMIQGVDLRILFVPLLRQVEVEKGAC